MDIGVVAVTAVDMPPTHRELTVALEKAQKELHALSEEAAYYWSQRDELIEALKFVKENYKANDCKGLGISALVKINNALKMGGG